MLRHTACMHYFFNHSVWEVSSEPESYLPEWKNLELLLSRTFFWALLIQKCRHYIMYQFVLNKTYGFEDLRTISSLTIGEYIWLIFLKGHRSGQVTKSLISILWFPCITSPQVLFFRGPRSASSFMILYCYGNCDITQQLTCFNLD